MMAPLTITITCDQQGKWSWNATEGTAKTVIVSRDPIENDLQDTLVDVEETLREMIEDI